MQGDLIMSENPATTAGPNRDGSKSLAPESKVGVVTTLVLTSLATGAIGYLGDLDLSTLPGWAVATATTAVASVVGLLSAYVKRNR
jgi:hypothetical protein